MMERESEMQANTSPAPGLVRQYRWFVYIPYLNAIALSVFYFVDTARGPRPLRKRRILAWVGAGVGWAIAVTLLLLAVYVNGNLSNIALILYLLAYQLLLFYGLAVLTRILDRLFRRRREEGAEEV